MNLRPLSRFAFAVTLMTAIAHFHPIAVLAQTIVIGQNITDNTTWFKANSPYHVTGNIKLYQAELTIEAGVHVIFDAGVGLTLGQDYNGFGGPFWGSIKANGTDTDPIYFEQADKSGANWGGIYFSTGSALDPGSGLGASIMTHCIVDHAGVANDGLSSGVYCYLTGQPAMDHCTIQNSTGVGLHDAGSLSLTSVRFTGNGSYDVYLDGTGGSFTDCTFSSGDHIAFFDAVQSSVPAFSNCHFHGGSTHGATYALVVPPASIDSASIAPTGTGGVDLDGYSAGIKLVGGATPVGSYRSYPALSAPQYYEITGKLTIGKGATLRLQPGVLMKGAEGASILVGGNHFVEPPLSGSLMAVGTELKPIMLTSLLAAPNNWGGLYFTEGTGNGDLGSQLSWCTIDHAGNANGGNFGVPPTENTAVVMHGTNPLSMDNCSITNSSGIGMRVMSRSDVLFNITLDAVHFSGNAMEDVHRVSHGWSAMSNCTFETGTHSGVVDDPGLDDGWFSNCTFHGTSAYALEVSPGSIDSLSFTRTVAGSRVSNITGYSKGIRVLGNTELRGDYGVTLRTWPPLDGSQYYELSAPGLTISRGSLLLLKPGVVLKGGPGARISVGVDYDGFGGPYAGSFAAVGTADKPIVLGSVSPTPNNWGGLYFSDGSNVNGSTSQLAYCRIEEGGNNGLGGIIACANTHQPSIQHCIIQNSSGYGLVGGSSSVTVGSSSIKENTLGGAAGAFSAQGNWWGDATGPHDPSPIFLYNPTGRGQYVDDNVDYQNWLTSEPCIFNPTVTVTAGPGGSITPTSLAPIACGSSPAFDITASLGYVIASVLVDGVDLGPKSPVTFPNISGDHTLSATFVSAPPPITISINDVQHLEGNGCETSPTPFTFTVTLSGAATSPVTVGWHTEDVTATAGSDYVAQGSAGSPTTLTFIPGEALTQTVTVPVNGDLLPETDETFNVVLSGLTGPPGVTLGKSTGLGTIQNDDRASLPANLLAWWAFDDTPGFPVRDMNHLLSGLNAGAKTGSASVVPGRVGHGLSCGPGSEGMLATANGRSLFVRSSSGIGMDAWINLNSSVPTSERVIASASTSLSTTPVLVFSVLGHQLQLEAYLGTFTAGTFKSNPIPSIEGAWHHVAFVEIPKSGTGAFYFDGVQVGTFATSSFVLGNLMNVAIGYRADAGAGLDGTVDEVDVFRPSSKMTTNDATIAEICRAGAAGKHREFVRLPKRVTLGKTGGASFCARIANMSSTDQTSSWKVCGQCVGGTGSSISWNPETNGTVVVPTGSAVDISLNLTVADQSIKSCTLTLTGADDGTGLSYGGTINIARKGKVSGRSKGTCPTVSYAPSTGNRPQSATSAASTGGTADFVVYNDGDTPASLTCQHRGDRRRNRRPQRRHQPQRPAARDSRGRVRSPWVRRTRPW